jgi:hypothetical protein
MTEVIEKEDDGTEKVVVTDTKVIRGTVERVTGAGNVIVYPVQHDPDVKTGEEALIVTDKTVVKSADFTLELLKEHISSPYASDFAIVVRARDKSMQRCRVFLDGLQLQATDSSGAPRYELPLPLRGWLTFRIPDNQKVRRDSLVDLRDGDVTIVRESVGNLPGAAVL